MNKDQNAIAGNRVEQTQNRKVNHSILKARLLGRFNKAAAPSLVFAGFWYRLLAFLIDFPLSIALSLVIITLLEFALPGDPLHLTKVSGNTVAILFLQFLYFSFFEGSSWKATPGKRILKLRVTDLRGQRLSLAKSALRTASKVLIFASCGTIIFFIFITEKYQSGYDKISRTLVLRKTTESFIPMSAARWQYLVVVLMCFCICFVTLRSISMVVAPRFDTITLNVIVEQKLKDIQPAQKAVEDAFLKNGKMPAVLDVSLFPQSRSVSYVYQPKDGSLAMIFNTGKLSDKGLLLQPMFNKDTKDLVWACSGINLPVAFTPNRCMAAKAGLDTSIQSF